MRLTPLTHQNCLCAVTVLLIALASGARATTYHFSSSLGNDSWSGALPAPNPGNTDGPKQSVEAAATVLQSSAQPGDSVLFRRGDAWSANSGLSFAETHGLPDSPIVVGSYGSGARPIFDIIGNVTFISIRGSDATPPSYIRFEDLHVTTTAQPGNRPSGVGIVETIRRYFPHHITFDSLWVEGLRYGFSLQSCSDITVQNCTIRNNFGIEPETGHTQGMYVHATNVTVRNNLFEGNGKPDSWFDWNTYLGQGTGYVYEGNTVCNALSGVKVRCASHAVVRGNTFYGLGLVGISVGGDINGGIDSVLVERNLIYNTVDGITIKDQSGGGSVGINHLIVRNNVLHSNDTTAPMGYTGYSGYITITNDPIRDVYIYNNLLYDVAGKRTFVCGNTSPVNLAIRNNIFVRFDTARSALQFADSAALTNIALDHNLYYFPGGTLFDVAGTGYTGLAALRSAFPAKEANGQEGDPAFEGAPDDFRLTSASVLAIDMGCDAAGLVDHDFAGLQRPQDGDSSGSAQWDIGPYELPDPSGVIALLPATRLRPGTHRCVAVLLGLRSTAGLSLHACDVAGRAAMPGRLLAPGLYVTTASGVSRSPSLNR